MIRTKRETGKRITGRNDKGTNIHTRDTYKYELKMGNKVVYIGTTMDLKGREKEHQINLPGTRIEQVGRRTTRIGAQKWEAKTIREKRIPMSGAQIRNAAKYVVKFHGDALRELERH